MPAASTMLVPLAARTDTRAGRPARLPASGPGKEAAEELLAGRDEGYATLVAAHRSDAHSMYLRWGRQIAGRFADPPLMDVQVVPLNTTLILS